MFYYEWKLQLLHIVAASEAEGFAGSAAAADFAASAAAYFVHLQCP